MLGTLTVEDFKPLIGDSFRVGDTDVELRLESVRAVMESERAQLRRQPFSLYFRGPLEPHLPQATYPLRNETFDDTLEIFLVPVGRNATGIEYEAVFT